MSLWELKQKLTELLHFEQRPSGMWASIGTKELTDLFGTHKAADLDSVVRAALTEGGLPYGKLHSAIVPGEKGSVTTYWVEAESDTKAVDLDAFFLTICEAYEIDTAMGKAALKQVLANVKLLDGKQKDYGPNAISAFGTLGVLIRATDKVERLKNLIKPGATPQNESVADSWSDLANYGLIGQLVHNGTWK